VAWRSKLPDTITWPTHYNPFGTLILLPLISPEIINMIWATLNVAVYGLGCLCWSSFSVGAYVAPRFIRICTYYILAFDNSFITKRIEERELIWYANTQWKWLQITPSWTPSNKQFIY